MILDLKRKTVTFEGPTTLSLDQLWALVGVFDIDDISSIVDDNPEAGRLDYQVKKIREMKSFSGEGTYTLVQFEGDIWACSCKDWINRRSNNFESCKHINSVAWR